MRYPEDKIKEAILHPDIEIRDRAMCGVRTPLGIAGSAGQSRDPTTLRSVPYRIPKGKRENSMAHKARRQASHRQPGRVDLPSKVKAKLLEPQSPRVQTCHPRKSD